MVLIPNARRRRWRLAAVTVAMLAWTAGLSGSHLAAQPAAAQVTRAAVQGKAPSTVLGKASSPALANGLAQTPYMGWNTYYGQVKVTQATILAEAQAMASDGLEAAGYDYIWLDGGWDPSNFPNGMAWLTSQLHQMGFKAGIYVDADAPDNPADPSAPSSDRCIDQSLASGTDVCGGPDGVYQQAVNQYAAWGFDAIKVDFVYGGKAEDAYGWPADMTPEHFYSEFSTAVQNDSPSRPMLLNLCNYLTPGAYEDGTPSEANSAYNTWSYAPGIANSWRTDTDIGFGGSITWPDVLRNLQADAAHPTAAGPGHWNDPDYLGPQLGMTAAQAQAQFTMWAMLSAPLMIGSNIAAGVTGVSGGPSPASGLSTQSLAMLENSAVIAIDQDPLGAQATAMSFGAEGEPTATQAPGQGQVWVKPLANGNRAVAFLNRGSTAVTVQANAAGIGLPATTGYTVDNLWTGTQTTTSGDISATVPAGSAVLYEVSPSGSPLGYSCSVNNGTSNSYLCQYGLTGPYVFPDGTEEDWVVTGNNSVWTTYSDETGAWHWASLGGTLTSGVSVSGSGWAVSICAIGGNGQDVWCDNRGDSQYAGWSGWWDTGPVEPYNPSILTSCNWNSGSYYCQYGITGPHVFPDGTEEYWVAAGSNSVWTYWDDETGAWHWTGLTASSNALSSTLSYTASGWVVDLYAYEGAGEWCDVRGGSQYSGWSGWYPAGSSTCPS